MDMNEIAALFHIHKAAHEHGEAFKNIRDQALARLKEIDADHAPRKEDHSEDVVVVEDELPGEDGDAEHQRRV